MIIFDSFEPLLANHGNKISPKKFRKQNPAEIGDVISCAAPPSYDVMTQSF